MGFAHAYGVELFSVPFVDDLERDRRWRDISEERINVFPAALPIRAGAGWLAFPGIGGTEAREAIAKAAGRVLSLDLARLDGGLAGTMRAARFLPLAVPALRNGPCVRP